MQVRLGPSDLSTPGAHPTLCVEVRPLAAVGLEACGNGSGLIHHDSAPELAHFRGKAWLGRRPAFGGQLGWGVSADVDRRRGPPAAVPPGGPRRAGLVRRLRPWLPPWLPELEVRDIRVGRWSLHARVSRAADGTVQVSATGDLDLLEGAPGAPLWGSPFP